MRIIRTSEDLIYLEPLKEGSVHVVAFAEEGFSHFKALAEFSLGLSIGTILRACDEINSKDETGTLYGRGNLTALPKRFFRDEILDKEGLRRCLRDAFIANRDYCKSRHCLKVFSCSTDVFSYCLKVFPRLEVSCPIARTLKAIAHVVQGIADVC